MGLRDETIAKNKQRMDALPLKIENAEMVFDGETVQVELRRIESKSGKSVGYTPVCDDFPEGMIRMYVPIFGMAGFVPTEDEVKALFKGEVISAKGLCSNKGSLYDKDHIQFVPHIKAVASDGKEMPFHGTWDYGN